MAGILIFEPASDLLRRPVLLQFNRNDPLQWLVAGKQTKLGTTRRLPGRPVGLSGAIVAPPSMPGYLLTDRRNSPVQLPGNDTERLVCGNAARDLFALCEAQ